MTQQSANTVVQKSEALAESRGASPRSGSPSVRPRPDESNDPPPTRQPTVVRGALTASMALALAQRLGLTDEDIACLLDAKDTTPEESQLDARVNSEAIARAYPASVTAALAETGSPIAVKCTKVHTIEAHAARVRGAVRVVEKLTAATGALERAVRGDADVLDQVTREIVPQIRARAAVVAETGATFSSVLAYHQARYPGRHKKPKTPKP